MISSMIRTFLTEAPEDIRVPNVPGDSSAAPLPGAAMDDANFAPPTAGGMGMALPGAPAMPSMDPDNATIQKTVINTSMVKSITAELKAAVANIEKQFDDDMTLEATQIYLSNFLKTLAFYAEKLGTVAGIQDENATITEPPVEEAVAQELPPMPEEAVEVTTTYAPQELTSPEEAIQ